MLTGEEIAGWRAGLDSLHACIAGHFRRAKVRERAKRYLTGLLDRIERKNSWQLAEHLGEARCARRHPDRGLDSTLRAARDCFGSGR